MWIQKRQEDNRHDLHSKTASGEMPRAECRSIHDVCRPHQSVRLWKIMAKFGFPPRFIAMVRQFHDVMQAHVQNDGEFSEPFEVTYGVKRGCVMAPTLFSMVFSAMLMDAFQDSDTGFPISYRFDGNPTLEGCKPKLRCRLMC